MSNATDKIPSNSEIISGMEKEVATLDRVEKDPSMTYKGERILEDLKRVIKDEEALVQQKNSGETVQRLLKHGYMMAVDLSHDERFNQLFSNWGSLFASAVQSGNWTEITKAAGNIATDLRNTESFIALLAELQNTIQLLLSQKVDQATKLAEKAVDKISEGVETVAEGAHDKGVIKKDTKNKAEDVADKAASTTEDLAKDARSKVHDATGVSSSSKAISDEKYQRAQEKHRRKLLHQLSMTLDSLSKNPTWNMLMTKAQNAKDSVQKEGVEPAVQLISAVGDSKQGKQLVKDFKQTLQNIAGPDVDVKPAFKHAKAVFNHIMNDSSYFDIINQLKDELVAIAQNPRLMENKATQDKRSDLFTKVQEKIDQLQNNPDMVAARKESQKVLDAIMKDPLTNKLVKDTRTLLAHLHSVKPGHLLDPDLLLQARGLIMPLVLEHLREMKMPIIEDVADTPLGKYKYTVDNLRLDISEIMPDNIHLKFKYDLDAHPVSLSYNHQHAFLVLEVRDIQVKIKDVEWTYDHLGTPHMHDSGRMDLTTEGKGICLRLKMKIDRLGESYTNVVGQHVENKDMLSMVQGQCWVDKWHIKFHDSKHDTLYQMLANMYSEKIKKGVQDRILDKLRDFTASFNHGVYVLLNEASIKQQEAKYRLKQQKSDLEDSWKKAKREAKLAIAESAPVAAAKDAAISVGKEAVKIGIDSAKAPNLSAAVANAGEKVKEKLTENETVKEAQSLVEDVQEKADQSKKQTKKELKETAPPSV
eukprot:TRINITY_DN4326_c0_g1_i4.p1 TRINITY_DN4326_c0_g1~~TRINITY_DN4326_c0_g1_i4.p1  ORF type:complete len:777 (+),score=369.44 TRINITY_DN4326_c0_g1_i4:56-2332(+)